MRGLYRFYEELALRFAERGYAAIAFDYFGRTAGASTRDDGFEYMPHVDQTTDDGVHRTGWVRVVPDGDGVLAVRLTAPGGNSENVSAELFDTMADAVTPAH